MQLASLVNGRSGPIDVKTSSQDYHYPPSPAFSRRSSGGRAYSDASCGAESHSNCSCDSHGMRLPSISSLLADCPGRSSFSFLHESER